MKIVVVGAGAIGSLIAAKLDNTENEIILVATKKTAEAIRKRGKIIVDGLTRIETDVKVATEIPDAEWHILAVKNYHLDLIIPKIKIFKSNVLACQNGLLSVNRISAELGEKRVAGMVTGIGAKVMERGLVKHTGYGYTVIGEKNGNKSRRVEKLSEIFNKAEIKTEITENLKGEIWLKTIVNAAINPVTAISKNKNGALLSGVLKERARKICREGKAVAAAYDINLPSDPWEKTMEIVSLTVDNESSMLQDVKKGRRTEIEAINGEISRLGKKRGVKTPENDKIIEEMSIYA